MSIDTKPRIVVVDDDEAIRDSLLTLLKLEGWEAQAFENGQEFLDAFDPDRDKCVLLDINMPIMNGYEVIDALHTMNHKIPIVLITSVDLKRTREQLFNLGVVSILLKPLENDQLFSVISKILDSQN